MYRDEDIVVVKKEDGTLAGIAWNVYRETGCEKKEFCLHVPAEKEEICLMKKRVDETVCNPLKVWHDIGEPANVSAGQIQLLRDAAVPLVATERVPAAGGHAEVIIEVEKNGVVYFEVAEAPVHGDRGYEYGR